MRNIRSILLLSLISTLLASCGFIRPVAYDLSESTESFDAVIVPGFPYDDEEGRMNAFQRMRLFWAYHLYQTGATKHIIVSGSAVHTPYVEAEIFAMYLEKLGVDPRHIIIENRAEHSVENVYYSMELARSHGFHKVGVATDPLQHYWFTILFRKAEMPIIYLPSDLATIGREYYTMFDMRIDPSPAFVSDFTPLKERESRKQRMSGTRGEKYLRMLEQNSASPAVSVR